VVGLALSLVAPLQTATLFRNPLNSSALVAAGSAR